MKYITSREELRSAFDATHDVAIKKVLRSIDSHSRRFIEKSPFLLIGSQDAAGNGDVSPKGDFPGFVKILDNNSRHSRPTRKQPARHMGKYYREPGSRPYFYNSGHE